MSDCFQRQLVATLVFGVVQGFFTPVEQFLHTCDCLIGAANNTGTGRYHEAFPLLRFKPMAVDLYLKVTLYLHLILTRLSRRSMA